MPLNNAKVQNANPGDKVKRLWDGGGLYLEVAKSGGKWWRLKYRFEGKEKRISLGVYPDVSLKEARARRDDTRKLLASGIDPSAYRKSQKAQNSMNSKLAADTFEEVAREWFVKQEPNWSPVHAGNVIRLLERDFFPWIGGTPVSNITPPELLESLQRIETRGALSIAHRALNTCGQVFRYAIATGRADRNPADSLRGALPQHKGEHFAATTDPAKVGALLRTLDGYTGTFTVECALKFAPLVFVRPGEMRRAQWQDINLDDAEWRYTATKTNTPHIVPLARQAVEILRELHPLTGRGRYVFPSGRSPKGDRPMSHSAVTSAMRRLGISKEEMSGHGFRAMARTIMDEELRVRPDYIEHQQAHTVRDPLGRAYNRTTHLAERREMMQKWADYLDELKSNAESQKK